jgi:mannose-6-phosphate isomerase
MKTLKKALVLAPQYRDYMWGGHRLRPGPGPTAEAWVVYEGDLVAGGPLAGRSLAEAAAGYGAALLGRRAIEKTGLRFPLLIKLLDCAAWLSLQVHPDNELAVRLEGPGNFGKTEAWHILEADPGAEILCGLRPGTSQAELEAAIRGGTLVDWMQRLAMHRGDSVFIPARMIHALGPGLLVYEVQQVSDITYRVFDWNRPASAGRPLHIEKSIQVADVRLSGQATPWQPLEDGGRRQLISCDYFTLEGIVAREKTITLDTQGETFHALTVVEGKAAAQGNGWRQELKQFETVVIPADCGEYQLNPEGEVKVLLASAG